MGLLEFFGFRRKALTASPEVLAAMQERRFSDIPRLGGGGTQARIAAAMERVQSAHYGWMYANQPAVRTVIDMISENVSQLGLKLYERVSDTERKHAGDHPAAEAMRHPNDDIPGDQFIFNLAANYLIFNNSFALKVRRGAAMPMTLLGLPTAQVGILGSSYFVTGYRVYRSDGTWFDVEADDILHWRRYNPDDPRQGLSPMETLRMTLIEDAAKQAASTELAKSGLRGGHIRRPLEAPEWDEQIRKNFDEAWANAMKASPKKTPVLEEGMEFINDAISPKDAEMLAGRHFTLETVANLYNVPIGLFTGEGDPDKQRQAFYSDVLAPISKKLASQLDLSLLRVEYGLADHYYEFDLNEKLRGQPEKRFAAITAAVGRPWMLVDEARAAENLPPVDEGDELTIPLNVALGSLPAPNVMPPQKPLGPPQDGSHREEVAALEGQTKMLALPRRTAKLARRSSYEQQFEALFRRHYTRLEGSQRRREWDDERWARFEAELNDDLHGLLLKLISQEGTIESRRMASEFRQAEIRNYTAGMAESIAKGVHQSVRAELRGGEPAAVFARAKNVRAPVAATSLAGRVTTIAALEAAKMSPDTEARSMTWIVNNPNSRHPERDGETVPVTAAFSHGYLPGDEPGCECILEVS